MPDGDFVDVAWGEKPHNMRGMVVLFHGLEGSVKSHYANDMMACLSKQGYQTVLMHFRGCSGEPNLTPRAYHSGDTSDARFFLERLAERYPDTPKVGVGFSLGANMLMKLLGEQPDQNYLRAAIAISPPMRLAVCSDSINRGFSRLYQGYLLKSMKQTLLSKMQKLDYEGHVSIDAQDVEKITSFREFDQHVTAPLHGYESADDYYARCSCAPFLKHVSTPSLILHSLDDPFMSPDVVPDESELSPFVRCEISERGGHVGFIQGRPTSPTIWLHKRVLRFIEGALHSPAEEAAC